MESEDLDWAEVEGPVAEASVPELADLGVSDLESADMEHLFTHDGRGPDVAGLNTRASIVVALAAHGKPVDQDSGLGLRIPAES
jgi:hypothetical protein